MLNDVIEADEKLAYADEGQRLNRLAFPVLKSYKPTVKPFYRKIGGLHFFRLGRYQLSFCKVRG